jgi:pimeloyl-ACP methyl ester carboxylesterase
VDFITLGSGPIKLEVAVSGSGPLIVCVHGFPELWYSWRHQIAHFVARGFRVAALNVRGYGKSSRPHEIGAYTLRNIASDVAAVIDYLSEGKAILFGHDWGAPIVWHTSLLHPDKVAAVAGLSVPFFPRGPAPFLEMMKLVYKDRFFYQIYFQQEGLAEAEFESDVGTSLRKIYFAASGDAPLNKWLEPKPVDAGLLDGMVNPDPFPAWLSESDLKVYADAFSESGFRGPLNRYRAQVLDFVDLAELTGRMITQPACFVAGERDLVRSLVPGTDLYANPGVACTDFRGSTIISGIGHWVQQEAPGPTTSALDAFVRGL